ncbi:MAG TPA: DUF418 domain-containing protein [Phototrophicaceae bacterium]|nr:DUF418 domain-containing protein [Phototrophicaceae bacterium]
MTNAPLTQRIAAIDVLRGFALGGILLVNILDFGSSAFRAGTLGIRGSTFDQLIDQMIVVFAVTKFYLLFSFLFGVGFAVQMCRMEATGRPFVSFYLRRLSGLFIIGLAHAVLLWDGDILRLYAIVGGLLLVVRKLPLRVLLGLALSITLGALIFFATQMDISRFGDPATDHLIPLLVGKNYAALVSYRLSAQLQLGSQFPIFQIPMVAVMFLLGLAVGRNGLLDQPERYQPFLRRWWGWALVVGLLGNFLLAGGYAVHNTVLVSIGIYVGAPVLSFAYASLVLLNVERLRALAPVGQMALTNYLIHSLVFTTVFYGYGLRRYDQLLVWALPVLVALIYGVQVWFSGWWLRRFRFGPVEWLWRSLTYGAVQPMARLNDPIRNLSA